MAWLTIALQFASSVWKSVKENPKLLRLLLEIGAGIWIMICCLTHCGSGNGATGGSSDTVTVSDTVLIYDTSWKSLLGDTVAYYENKLKEPKWEAPKPVFEDSDDCSDSLEIALQTLDYCNEGLTECDEHYRSDYAIREYGDSLLDDSLELRYNIKVRGKLLEKPRFDYQIRVPQKVITNTTTVTNTIGPFRKIYLGASAAPVMTMRNVSLRSAMASLRFGYTDKKNNSYGLKPSIFTNELWSVELEYTKSFDIGR